ncbi:MAG TPA: PAS domain-containing protein [Gemmatimonadaceae bacterium]|nr:PAS domain-containing protein [Gemmatimonadaceae bacterium]HRQ77428.1 PAS domain-containing protein [Gemmatimonadaceae bacterium]
MDTPTIVYRVDGEDRIVAVNGAWNAFASANGGGAITESRIIGRNLFEFVTDATTQQLYRQMLARIRGGQDLTYTYRCDSPNRRRLMEMEMRLVDDAGSVEFRSVPLEEQARAPLHVAQADGADDSEDTVLQRSCGWCNRLEVEGTWLEIEEAIPRLGVMEQRQPATLTHGMCDDCLERMLAELV